MIKIRTILALFLTTLFLSSCGSSTPVKIYKKEPASGSIGQNEFIYVENNGKCAKGQVIKVLAGSSTTRRTRTCVARPK